MSSIAYADDITLVSNTWDGLLRLLDLANVFFLYHHMSINTSKSFITSSSPLSTGELKYDPVPTELRVIRGAPWCDAVYGQLMVND